MHREDERQMVSQQLNTRFFPLCFWCGDVSGVAKMEFSACGLAPPVCFQHKPFGISFIHWLYCEMLLKTYVIKNTELPSELCMFACLHVENNLAFVHLDWSVLIAFVLISCLAGLPGGKSMRAKMMALLTILLSVITMQRCQDWIGLQKS